MIINKQTFALSFADKMSVRIAFFDNNYYHKEFVDSLTDDGINIVLAHDEENTFAMTLEEFENGINKDEVDTDNNYIRFFIG